ncbi:hypothetical protein AMTR_s00066p00064040 [Amborella trichopoda]|uniref:Pentacotripeptide-repeat region of PRORP domain-containing protein n=2 Tax=Amborella trichopoda TaxID=13333 RepID=U5DD39_AMBTC|nr:hypothetical protein AMTR_s00066p00064040 [Amborella trichopoda]
MADYLCRRKLFDDLRCLLKTVLSVKGSVNARTLSICIRFLGRDGRVDEALSLFQEMESLFNCSPDNLVFNNMLYVLCKKAASDDQSLNLGSIDSAFSIFKRMECPDTYSYSNLLIGFCQFGKIDRALDVFNEMVKVGMTPTRSAINNLIGGLCDENSERLRCEKLRINDHRRPFSIMVPNIAKRSYIEPAIEVFKKVCELGLFPSAFVLNMLVFELCRVRELDEALDIVRIAETRDKAHVLDMYTIVIRALCKVRRVDEARESFDRVILLGLQPKLALYSSLICALCKIGSLVEAERVFDAMRKNKCDPDSVTYTVMIHGYCRVEKWEAAYGLLLEMFGMGWSPHFHTYSWVDDIVRKNGRDDLALKLERKLEIQVLQSHCKAGRLEAAHKKLGSMIERGVYPPIYTRDLFERAFQKAGKYHVAREILEKIQR